MRDSAVLYDFNLGRDDLAENPFARLDFHLDCSALSARQPLPPRCCGTRSHDRRLATPAALGTERGESANSRSRARYIGCKALFQIRRASWLARRAILS
jgi:hypothetical protein